MVFFNEVGGRGDKLYSNLFTLISLLGYRLNNDLVKYFLDKTRLVSLYPDLYFFFLPLLLFLVFILIFLFLSFSPF